MKDDTEPGSDGGPVGEYRGGTEPGEGGSMGEFDGLAEATVAAVSALTGTHPMELKPLHDAVEVDALENLFAPKANGTTRPAGIVSFTYAGCRVIVEGTDQVTVEQGTETVERP